MQNNESNISDIKNKVLTDWFLFAPQCMRIAPSLIINEEEIEQACEIILKMVDQ